MTRAERCRQEVGRMMNSLSNFRNMKHWEPVYVRRIAGSQYMSESPYRVRCGETWLVGLYNENVVGQRKVKGT